jgi:hypothetical protein
LPGVSLIGLLIVVISDAAGASIVQPTSLMRDLIDGIMNILLIPFAIAIYRLLLLNDASSRYVISFSAKPFQRLLIWEIAFWALGNLPEQLLGLMTSSEITAAIAFLGATILCVVIAVRLAVLFPAIAIDAAGASLKNSLADSSGRFWFIVKALLVALAPLFFAALLMIGLASLGIVGDRPGLTWSSTPRVLLTGLLDFYTQISVVVVASRLFTWIGDHVNGAPSSTRPLFDFG